MAPFYGWGSTVPRLEPLQGGSLLCTTKLPVIPGTHFIDLGRIKGWVDPVVLSRGPLNWTLDSISGYACGYWGIFQRLFEKR